MNNNIFKLISFYFITSSILICQDATIIDSTISDDENSEYSAHNFFFSFEQQDGNTNSLYTSGEYSFVLVGNLIGLDDTEFSFSTESNYATLSDEAYILDGNIHTQLDLWANQNWSPFIYYDYSFDRSLGLINRENFAAGIKRRLGKVFSLSYAFMSEKEEYDSLKTFARHSIRPKLKLKINDGAMVFDYRLFYKPKVDNSEYLFENDLTVSIATFYEMLTVDLNFKHAFNSRYADNKIEKPYDDWVSEIPEYYKDTDWTVSFGLGFSF